MEGRGFYRRMRAGYPGEISVVSLSWPQNVTRYNVLVFHSEVIIRTSQTDFDVNIKAMIL